MEKGNEDENSIEEPKDFFLLNHNSILSKENNVEIVNSKINSNYYNKNEQINNSINKKRNRFKNNVNNDKKDIKRIQSNSLKIIDYSQSNSSIHFSNIHLVNQKNEVNLNDIKIDDSIKNEEISKQNSKVESSYKDSVIVPFDDDESEDLNKVNKEIVFDNNNNQMNLKATQYIDSNIHNSKIVSKNIQSTMKIDKEDDTISNSIIQSSVPLGIKNALIKKNYINSAILQSIPIQNSIKYSEFSNLGKSIKEMSFKDYLGNDKYYNKNENIESINRKLLGLKENAYFKNYIINEKSIMNIITKNKDINYINTITKNVKLKPFFLNMFHFIDINEKNHLYNNLNHNTNTEYLISPLINSKNDFESIYHIQGINFEYFRYINSDNGDSFYRSFIFALLEHCILKKNIDLFSVLIFDIFRLDEIEDIYFHLNKEKVFMLLNIIYDLMRADEYEEAYEILIKSYIKSDFDDFDQILIRYLRYCIYGYLNNLESENEINCNFSLSIIYYNEPTRFIIEALSNIFNVNLKIYYIEGNMNEMNDIDFISINQSNIDIRLGYFYSSYHIIYKERLKFNCSINYYISDTSNILNGMIIEKERQCLFCKTNSKYIEISKLERKICSNCLEKKISDILNKRIELFSIENYLNFSYYMRPIILSNNLNLTFNDANCKNIFNYSFSYIWSNNIQNLCFKCKSIKVETLTLICGCQYCKSCLLEKINKLTNHFLILNGYEKKNYKNEKCVCDKNFDLNEGLKLIEYDKIYIRKAIERMINIIDNNCFICEKNIEQLKCEVPSNKQNNKYYEINITIPNFFIQDKTENLDYVNDKHIICSNCYKKESQNKKLTNFTYQSREYIKLFCQLCNIYHLIDKISWKKLSPKSSCGCNIF